MDKNTFYEEAISTVQKKIRAVESVLAKTDSECKQYKTDRFFYETYCMEVAKQKAKLLAFEEAKDYLEFSQDRGETPKDCLGEMAHTYCRTKEPGGGSNQSNNMWETNVSLASAEVLAALMLVYLNDSTS